MVYDLNIYVYILQPVPSLDIADLPSFSDAVDCFEGNASSFVVDFWSYEHEIHVHCFSTNNDVIMFSLFDCGFAFIITILNHLFKTVPGSVDLKF